MLQSAAEGDPIALTAPGVLEIIYGLAGAAAASAGMEGALVWFTRLVTSEFVATLPLNGPAAVVAGRLRADNPAPPTGKKRIGTKPEQLAAWVLDLQIAATAWAAGHALATANRLDFDTISKLIAELYPGVPPLEVLDPPDLS